MHLKGILPFKMHKIIFFSRKPEKNSRFPPVNLDRVGLPLTQVFFLFDLRKYKYLMSWHKMFS